MHTSALSPARSLARVQLLSRLVFPCQDHAAADQKRSPGQVAPEQPPRNPERHKAPGRNAGGVPGVKEMFEAEEHHHTRKRASQNQTINPSRPFYSCLGRRKKQSRECQRNVRQSVKYSSRAVERP